MRSRPERSKVCFDLPGKIPIMLSLPCSDMRTSTFDTV